MNCSGETGVGFCNDGNLILLPILVSVFQYHYFIAFMYFVAMIYIFYGTAIITDIFMECIYEITKATREVRKWSEEKQCSETVRVPVWNDTVANIALMAMGNSTANTLFSVMEVVGNGFTSGSLGPASVVGSNAFLFVVTAFCVISTGNFQAKRVLRVKSYIVNVVFTLFSNVWVYLVLEVFTPGFVNIEEAALTCLFFPLFVLFGFFADRNFFMASDSDPMRKKLTKKSVRRFIERARSTLSLSRDECKQLASYYTFRHQQHSSLFYRISTTRVITGRESLIPELNHRLQSIYNRIEFNENSESSSEISDKSFAKSKAEYDVNVFAIANEAIVELETDSQSVCESRFDVVVRRTGLLNSRFQCTLQTIDRTAVANRDYTPVNETIEFEAMQTSKSFSINVVPNMTPAFERRMFLVALSLPNERIDVKMGAIAVMRVNIGEEFGDNYEDIAVEFQTRVAVVSVSDAKLSVSVVRSGEQSEREIVVKWKTVDGSAKNGEHFVGGSGDLVFAPNVGVASIHIPIVCDCNSMSTTKRLDFDVVLLDAMCALCGVTIGHTSKVNVILVKSEHFERTAKSIRSKLSVEKGVFQSWTDQIEQAFHFGDRADGERPSAMAHFNHMISFGWKLFFALLLPPRSLWLGYPKFFLSIFWIGATATLMGDFSTEFGCLVGINDVITASTLVALGTTLPNIFSSMIAARTDSGADNAICNSTASNAVTIYLGLGLAWLPGAVYQTYHGNLFYVPSAALGLSVLALTGMSVLFFAIVLSRRYLSFCGRAELGGPKWSAIVTCVLFLSFWMVYVAVTIVYS